MPNTRSSIAKYIWALCLLAGCTVHSYSTHFETHTGDSTGTSGAQRPVPQAAATHRKRADTERDHDAEGASANDAPATLDRSASEPRPADVSGGATGTPTEIADRSDTKADSHAADGHAGTDATTGAGQTSNNSAANAALTARAVKTQAAAQAAARAKQERDAARAAAKTERDRKAQEQREKAERDKQARKDKMAAIAAENHQRELERVEIAKQRAEASRIERATAAAKLKEQQQADAERRQQAKMDALAKAKAKPAATKTTTPGAPVDRVQQVIEQQSERAPSGAASLDHVQPDQRVR